jgi:carbon storage regulator CsrA
VLILARNTDEQIIITTPGGTQIVVTVVDFPECGRRVRLGIAAPRDVTIHRAEVQARVDGVGPTR